MDERRQSGLRRPGQDEDARPAAAAPVPVQRAHPQGHADGSRAGESPADRALPPPLGEADGEVRASEAPEPMRVIEILSHELRSPITTIHLGTKVLREQGRRIARPVRDEVVEAVEEEAERLYRLVEDLLAVARHEGGAAPLPVGPLQLQRWLPGVIAAEVHAYPALAVRASIPPELPPVLADDGALQQVMRNLLANAVRYAPDGMPVEVVASPSGHEVGLEVLDRGPGIDAAEAERLFDPFYRTAAAVARGSGAGLGLAAARRLLRAMNGTIRAQPRDGGGTRFVLTLPIATPESFDDRESAA
ncbi:MAG TPA: ATP-binding protein [Candidatus Limnocylindrales bacterium]|nr:ATP-binding protein [Candidatus Limnocylindrales bacterium]